MKKLYLYIRLSDADDDLKFKTESESIANQRTLLYRFIRARREFDGYEVVEFIDDGYSGTNGNRPSFERMIESLKNGEANVVICKDFSRFFRDYVEIGDYLERIFPFLGVRFIAVNDGYAEGRLQRDIYLIERDKMNTESDSLSEEKERLEKELLSLSQSKNRELTETCGMARRTLTADELTNEMLLFFIDRVNVYSGMRVEIIYRFSDEIARLIGQENTAE